MLVEEAENGRLASPEGEIGQRETYYELYQCLQKLPGKYRLPVYLHYLEGFDYVEVANILHKPVNTVKSHGLRGLTMLRVMMREEG